MKETTCTKTQAPDDWSKYDIAWDFPIEPKVMCRHASLLLFDSSGAAITYEEAARYFQYVDVLLDSTCRRKITLVPIKEYGTLLSTCRRIQEYTHLTPASFNDLCAFTAFHANEPNVTIPPIAWIGGAKLDFNLTRSERKFEAEMQGIRRSASAVDSDYWYERSHPENPLDQHRWHGSVAILRDKTRLKRPTLHMHEVRWYAEKPFRNIHANKLPVENRYTETCFVTDNANRDLSVEPLMEDLHLAVRMHDGAIQSKWKPSNGDEVDKVITDFGLHILRPWSP